MLQGQFYFRLLLIIGLGLIYVKTMMRMGQYKPAEETKKKSNAMKVTSGIFVFLGLLSGGVGICLMPQINHPTEMIEPSISPNGIIRSYGNFPIWGYATFAQYQVINFISNCMVSLGVGAYFLFYRKSHSVWWKKVLKFIYGLLLSVFYVTATDFHYFDMYEWPRLILFCIMAFYVSKRIEKTLPSATTSPESICDMPDITSEQKGNTIIEKENETRFMPKEITEVINEIDENPDTTETELSENSAPQETPTYRFCRYCGKKLDYECIKYCKHCGKPID